MADCYGDCYGNQHAPSTSITHLDSKTCSPAINAVMGTWSRDQPTRAQDKHVPLPDPSRGQPTSLLVEGLTGRAGGAGCDWAKVDDGRREAGKKKADEERSKSIQKKKEEKDGDSDRVGMGRTELNAG